MRRTREEDDWNAYMVATARDEARRDREEANWLAHKRERLYTTNHKILPGYIQPIQMLKGAVGFWLFSIVVPFGWGILALVLYYAKNHGIDISMSPFVYE